MSASVPNNEWIAETTTPPPVRLPRLGDERLAWLAARGSTRAFAAVYERYHQPLYRYCRSIVRDDADAQDALQSTFTRALSALKRDQRSAPLRPWLFRIAHNESVSVLRRRRGGDGSDPARAVLVPLVPSAEDQAGERARLSVLMDDLAALPDRARNALVMRELSGLSHEDIAIALDISEGAAKQAIFEARRGLHECAEGRAMLCAEVCRAISDADRRVLRGRRVRAHLRDCGSCSAFAASIKARQSDLRALVPALPAAASGAVLARALHTAASHGGGGGGAAASTAVGAAGKTMGVAFSSKGFATASVLATAAVSVGGVAAVVRLAPESGRLGFAHSGKSARISSAHHHASSGVYGGSRAQSSSGSSGSSGSLGSSGSSVGSLQNGTHTGATSRQVRLTAWHRPGRAIGWHRAAFGPHGKSSSSGLAPGRSAPGRSAPGEPGRGQSAPGRFGQGEYGRGQSGEGQFPNRQSAQSEGQRGWGGHDGSQGDVSQHQGGSATGQRAGAVPDSGHGTLEGYAAGRGQTGAVKANSHGSGTWAGGNVAGGSGSGAGASGSGAGASGSGAGAGGNGAWAGANNATAGGNGAAANGTYAAANGDDAGTNSNGDGRAEQADPASWSAPTAAQQAPPSSS